MTPAAVQLEQHREGVGHGTGLGCRHRAAQRAAGGDVHSEGFDRQTKHPAQDKRRGFGVGGFGDHAQGSDQQAHLVTIVKGAAAFDHARQLGGAQTIGESICFAPRRQQDHHVVAAQRPRGAGVAVDDDGVAGEQLAQVADHGVDLVGARVDVAGVVVDEHDGIDRGCAAPRALGLIAGQVAVDVVDPVDDAARRAEVRAQHLPFTSGDDPVFQGAEGAEVRTAKAIDALAGIADGEEAAGFGALAIDGARQQQRDLGLDGIGVLHLVNQDDAVARGESLAGVVVVAQDAGGLDQQVVKVGDAVATFALKHRGHDNGGELTHDDAVGDHQPACAPVGDRCECVAIGLTATDVPVALPAHAEGGGDGTQQEGEQVAVVVAVAIDGGADEVDEPLVVADQLAGLALLAALRRRRHRGNQRLQSGPRDREIEVFAGGQRRV